MSFDRIALWILGPIGSGKSTLALRAVPAAFRIIDQDVELEQQALARDLPLDCRIHDEAQVAAFASLRTAIADALWAGLPQWRADGAPLAFTVTGDKPDFLQEELDLGTAAGYRNLAVALAVTEELCLARNRQRARVVPDAVVSKTVAVFERNLHDGNYERMFARGAFRIVREGETFDLAAWLRASAPS
jgi:predicted kinase